jgi:type IV pilus assembly protein PilO
MSSKGMDLRNLDTKNPGSWPLPIKMAACVVLILVLIGLTYYLKVSAQREELASLEAKELTLRAEFEDKQGRAANLEPLKQQLAQMELMLQQMLRQLPSKNEMPDLIVDVSQTALATGISNELFQPGPESAKEFYAEKPITLRMVGTYHQFGAFVSGVASLPRVVIMTMHNISLTPRAGKPGLLVLEGTIRTYRYLDDEEVANAQTAGGSK